MKKKKLEKMERIKKPKMRKMLIAEASSGSCNKHRPNDVWPES